MATTEQPPPRSPKAARLFWLSLSGSLLLVLVFAAYLNAERRVERANQARYRSYLLADEMRCSSDDLSHMARSYVATGNARFKRHYQEIIAIREGQSPRPLNAEGIYWDLVLDDDRRPRGFGPAVPLLGLMREAGFADHELAKLEEAKASSDVLARAEAAAMALVESSDAPSDELRMQATRLLNDAAYHQAKAAIMRPLLQFHDMVSERTQAAVVAAQRRARGLLLSMSVLGMVAIFGYCRLLAAIRRENRECQRVENELAKHQVKLEAVVEARTQQLNARNEELSREVAAHEQAARDLKESEAQFRFIAENSADFIWTMDVASGKYTYISPSVSRLRGYTPAEIINQPALASLTEESADRVRAQLEAAVSSWATGDRSSILRLDVDQMHKDGHIVHSEVVATLHADKDGKPASILGVTRDVTERKRAQEAVQRLAFYDAVTELPNRHLLLDRLQQSLARAERKNCRVALLFLDLDHFKPVNDQMGHETGDWLLRSAAKRMLDCLRGYDTAARFGGDEFVLLLPDIELPEDAIAVGERVRAALEKPFVTSAGHSLQVSASIGVALFPDHAGNQRDLLRASDEAMYQAKKGRNRVVSCAADLAADRATCAAEQSLLRLIWQNTYMSGNAAIDGEHRQLFRSGNRLLELASKAAPDPRAIQQEMQKLVVELVAHFEREETILAERGYEKLREHAALHSKLLWQGKEALAQAEKDQLPLRDLLDFVVGDFISGHMLHADKDFFPLFRTNA